MRIFEKQTYHVSGSLERVPEPRSMWRRVDILINAAGVNSATSFLERDEEEWEHIMSVNLKGAFTACQVLDNAILKQALEWSEAVNATVADLVSGIPRFRMFGKVFRSSNSSRI